MENNKNGKKEGEVYETEDFTYLRCFKTLIKRNMLHTIMSSSLVRGLGVDGGMTDDISKRLREIRIRRTENVETKKLSANNLEEITNLNIEDGQDMAVDYGSDKTTNDVNETNQHLSSQKQLNKPLIAETESILEPDTLHPECLSPAFDISSSQHQLQGRWKSPPSWNMMSPCYEIYSFTPDIKSAAGRNLNENVSHCSSEMKTPENLTTDILLLNEQKKGDKWTSPHSWCSSIDWESEIGSSRIISGDTQQSKASICKYDKNESYIPYEFEIPDNVTSSSLLMNQQKKKNQWTSLISWCSELECRSEIPSSGIIEEEDIQQPKTPICKYDDNKIYCPSKELSSNNLLPNQQSNVNRWTSPNSWSSLLKYESEMSSTGTKARENSAVQQLKASIWKCDENELYFPSKVRTPDLLPNRKEKKNQWESLFAWCSELVYEPEIPEDEIKVGENSQSLRPEKRHKSLSELKDDDLAVKQQCFNPSGVDHFEIDLNTNQKEKSSLDISLQLKLSPSKKRLKKKSKNIKPTKCVNAFAVVRPCSDEFKTEYFDGEQSDTRSFSNREQTTSSDDYEPSYKRFRESTTWNMVTSNQIMEQDWNNNELKTQNWNCMNISTQEPIDEARVPALTDRDLDMDYPEGSMQNSSCTTPQLKYYPRRMY